MLRDLGKVIVDYKEDKTASTGYYELIYESPFVKETQDLRIKSELIIEGTSMTNKK